MVVTGVIASVSGNGARSEVAGGLSMPGPFAGLFIILKSV
jgi:hypothetical protein